MSLLTRKRLLRFIRVILVIYLVAGIILYFVQDHILFHPTPLPEDHQFVFKQAFEEVNIPYGKNNISLVKFKPNGPSKGIVIFFHGNMDNVEHYSEYPSLFTNKHFEFWMMDYPGFGKSTGQRSEKIMEEQGLVVYDLATKEMTGDNIIIYGKSVGTGLASYVAANRNSSRLILETPYYSIVALAWHYFPIYPVSLMMHYLFPIHEYLKKVKAPVIIFHGMSDETVPYSQSVRLARENLRVTLITINHGKHNDLFSFPSYRQKMDSLLSL